MATKAEKEWMEQIVDFGCIVCYLFHNGARTPAEVHHLTSGGKRQGHLMSISLCAGHHRKNELPFKIARHPTGSRFKTAYGSELQLLMTLRELIARNDIEENPHTRPDRPVSGFPLLYRVK